MVGRIEIEIGRIEVGEIMIVIIIRGIRNEREIMIETRRIIIDIYHHIIDKRAMSLPS